MANPNQIPSSTVEIVDIREQLFAEVVDAKLNFTAACDWLVAESIDDNDLTRDITLHPDYIEAKSRLDAANAAIEAFHNNQQ